MKLWRWTDSIHGLDDEDETRSAGFSPEDVEEAYWRSAERIAAEEGCDPGEALKGTICLWFVPEDSLLHYALRKWHESRGTTLEEAVRDYVEVDRPAGFTFVTGFGYSIWSADLLGGKADGEAQREFEAFLDDMLARLDA